MQLSSVAALVVLASVFYLSFAAEQLPDKFYGTFKLEKSEKFEEYLVAKGYGWLMRKIILFASITKVFEKGTKPGTFRFKTLTSKKDVKADNIVFGEKFDSEGLDSHQHHVLFTYDPVKDVVTESRLKIGDQEKNSDVYYYHIDGDYLVLDMSWKDVHCKHYYKRV
ncbi:hypothetical protein QR680_015076 [Steinernema hermaphroditum]|uniref:Cytosolic fatty-acid binding proteins domain-containing protein n=1 Tax=Steinernema hermaphroditum TaxID=289476 RepID=A0AA39ID96_9BILA|nr:hypothetical protein QR680_015076 [Steinernema hermaphroditum]